MPVDRETGQTSSVVERFGGEREGGERGRAVPHCPGSGIGAACASSDRDSGDDSRLIEALAFRKSLKVRLTPPKKLGAASTRTGMFKLMTAEKGGSLPDLTVVLDDNKRKRRSNKEEETHLKGLVEQLMVGIEELNRTISSATNTRRDVVQNASKLDILAKKLANGRLEELIEKLGETNKRRPNAKPESVDACTQTDKVYPTAWAVRKTYMHTTIKEGNPLDTEVEWDLLIFRKSTDLNMEKGVQRMFRNKFNDLHQIEGEVGHLKTATWVMGGEEEEPKTRHIFRVDDGPDGDMRRRMVEILKRMTINRRNKLAITWEEGSRLQAFRDTMEELAIQTGVEIAIHVRPAATRKVTQEKPTEAIYIKKKAGTSYVDILKDVREEVMGQGLGSTIRSVRETKAGELLLTVDKQQSDGDRDRIKEALQSKLGKDNVRTQRKRPEATIYVKDIEAVTTKGDIEEAILSELGGGDKDRIKVVSLRQGFAGTQNAIINLSRNDEKTLVEKRFIRIGLPKCRISADNRISTCYKCWLPGHSARNCDGPDRSKACRNCGEEGHMRRECTKTSKCVVCGESGHPANSIRCKTHRKNVLEEKGSRWTLPAGVARSFNNL